jgi:uncharacterized protein with PQ loop repeat
MDLPTIVSWIGTVIGIILNISPIVMFYSIIRGQKKIEIVPESMLIFNILCSSLWACYWYLQVDKFVPFFSSAFGLALSEIFALIYLFYLADKDWKKYILYAFLEINLVLEFNYGLLFVLGDYITVGNIAVVVNIITYITPGQKIYQVIKTKNYNLIPISSTLSGSLCTLCWLIFGLLIWDIRTIIPNGLGLIFATINSGVWAYFYFTRDKEEDEKEEKITPNEEEI